MAQGIGLYEGSGWKENSSLPLRTQRHFRSPCPWHRLQSCRWPEPQPRDGQARQPPPECPLVAQRDVTLVWFCFVTHFRFPNHSETFSFVLTGEDGSRRFGYCRRLLVSTSCSQAARALCGAGAGFLRSHSPRATREGAGGVASSPGQLKTGRNIWGSTWVLLVDGNTVCLLWKENTFSIVFPAK